MDVSRENSSKDKQTTACKSMKNSQEASSSSKVETMNENQQEAEVTISKGLREVLQEISAKVTTISEQIRKIWQDRDDGISDKKTSDSAGQSNLDGTSQSPQKGRFEQALEEVQLDTYRDLYVAVLKGDWETARRIIDDKPAALTAKISMLSKTVLHVAAYSCNHNFVEKLLQKMTPEQVAVVDVNGNTALHYAASTAAVDVAKALLRKNPGLTEVQGSQGFIPLLSAVVYGAAKGKEMAQFLAEETNNPFLEATSAHLLLELTHAGFHDITLGLLRNNPEVATVTVNESKSSILGILAARPMDFPSGTRLNFWETWIYQLAPCQPLRGAQGDVEAPLENYHDPMDPNPQARATRGFQFVCKSFKRHIWEIITTLAPLTCQKFLDLKYRHKCALKLVTVICEEAKKMSNEDILSYFVQKKILKRAAKLGIVEIIKVCVLHFPDIISIQSDDTKTWKSAKTVLDVAVKYRQESVFNLLCARSELCTVLDDKKKNYRSCRSSKQSYIPFRSRNTMHMAAKLAPSRQLSSISDTALQVQRELQWYKEVEKRAHHSEKEKKFQGKKPRELFTEQHKNLVSLAEKWMRQKSNFCMIVTTLVATVVFAAAFTVPGGHNSQGVPIFLEHRPFTVFIISDALALFSALTSILMFLSILTSSYAEEDFLKKLPIKLLIGLVSLLFAIGTMMIAFVATLWIVLADKFKWVSIPVTILASIPVAVFLSLQLPLCFQIYKSTFIGIFHPQNIWELDQVF